jgi:hypothetical protein
MLGGVDRRERWERRTLRNKDTAYPWPLVDVVDEEWMSQWDAAEVLDVSLFRVAMLVWTKQLVAARNPERVRGVTVESVQREDQRRGHTLTSRARALARDVLKVIWSGL